MPDNKTPEMPLEEIVNSTELLEDDQALRRRFQEDGYLYFRGALDSRAVQRVQKGCAEPVWTGLGMEHINDTPLYQTESYEELMGSPNTLRLIARVFGGP